MSMLSVMLLIGMADAKDPSVFGRGEIGLAVSGYDFGIPASTLYYEGYDSQGQLQEYTFAADAEAASIGHMLAGTAAYPRFMTWSWAEDRAIGLGVDIVFGGGAGGIGGDPGTTAGFVFKAGPELGVQMGRVRLYAGASFGYSFVIGKLEMQDTGEALVLEGVQFVGGDDISVLSGIVETTPYAKIEFRTDAAVSPYIGGGYRLPSSGSILSGQIRQRSCEDAEDGNCPRSSLEPESLYPALGDVQTTPLYIEVGITIPFGSTVEEAE